MRDYESEANLGNHIKVFLADLKLAGEIISFVHIPNEGKRSIKGHLDQRAQGLVKGASDYDVKLDYTVYTVASVAMELKTVKGELSEEQMRYLQTVHQPDKGHYACVIQARTGHEAVEMFKAVLDSLKRKEAS